VLPLRRTAPLFVAGSLVLVAKMASADCNRPDLLDAVPADGATNVPVNASLFARYDVNADYLDEPIKISHDGIDDEVQGKWNSAELLLSVSPPLTPGSEYTVQWPRLRGVNSANLGKNRSVKFTVGDQADTQPPVFDGLTSVDYDVDREHDDCTDSLEDRYTFDFELGHADDDGGRDSLMLVLFQSRGPYVSEGTPRPVAIRRLPKAGDPVRLTQTIADGAGDVCYAAIVRDLTGQASASGSRELCLKTEEPPFFNGCSTAPVRPGNTTGFLVGIALALGFGARRRRA
jgi:Bacterial Ig-like domain